MSKSNQQRENALYQEWRDNRIAELELVRGRDKRIAELRKRIKGLEASNKILRQRMEKANFHLMLDADSPDVVVFSVASEE